MDDLWFLILAGVCMVVLFAGFVWAWIRTFQYNLAFIRLWRESRLRGDIRGFGLFTIMSWAFGDDHPELSEPAQALLTETRRLLHSTLKLYAIYFVVFCLVFVLLLLLSPSRG